MTYQQYLSELERIFGVKRKPSPRDALIRGPRAREMYRIGPVDIQSTDIHLSWIAVGAPDDVLGSERTFYQRSAIGPLSPFYELSLKLLKGQKVARDSGFEDGMDRLLKGMETFYGEELRVLRVEDLNAETDHIKNNVLMPGLETSYAELKSEGLFEFSRHCFFLKENPFGQPGGPSCFSPFQFISQDNLNPLIEHYCNPANQLDMRRSL